MPYYTYPEPEYAWREYERHGAAGESYFTFTTHMARRHEEVGNIELAQAWRDCRWARTDLTTDLSSAAAAVNRAHEAMSARTGRADATQPASYLAPDCGVRPRSGTRDVHATDEASTTDALSAAHPGDRQPPALTEPVRLTTTQKGSLTTMNADYHSSPEYELDSALADADEQTRQAYWDAMEHRAAAHAHDPPTGPGPATSPTPRHEVTTGSTHPTHPTHTGRAQPTATDQPDRDYAGDRDGHPREGLTDEARRLHDVAVHREADARRWAQTGDEAAYHEPGVKAALEVDVAGAWRTAVEVEYDHVRAEYGNDGPPDTDRRSSAQDKAAQLAAIQEIAERTGLPTDAVWDAVRDTADGYRRSDGSDGADLGQPNWDQVADNWAHTMAERQSYRLRILADAVVDAVHRGEPTGLLDREIQREVFGPPHTCHGDSDVGGVGRADGTPRHDTNEAGPGPTTSPTHRHEVTTGSTHTADTVRAQPTATDEPDQDYVERFADSMGAVEPSADDFAFALIAELDATGPDPYPGDESAFWRARAAELAAMLAEELDQARARLESGDIPAEREHEQAEYIEHLEEQLANALLPAPADSANTQAHPPGSLNTALANELDGLADMVDLGGDPAADAWLKAQACGRREVYGLLRQRATELRQHPDTTAQAVAQASDTKCATERWQHAVTRAAEDLPDNPPADQVEYREQQATGKDPLARARHAIDHLRSTGQARDAPARADHHLDRGRTDHRIRGLSSGDEAGATGRDEPGW